jgi:hypothetical protein
LPELLAKLDVPKSTELLANVDVPKGTELKGAELPWEKGGVVVPCPLELA